MKYLRMICYGAFTLLLVIGGVFFLGPELPYIGTLEVKIVKSGSMEPKIMTGGIVALTEAPTYSVGDVITFDGENSSIPTTHRIIGTETVNGIPMFVTKGDANEERDNELALPSKVRGKVLFTLPYVGFILDFARKPVGFVLLIVLPALLIILDELEKIWKEMRILRARKKSIDLPPSIALAFQKGREDDEMARLATLPSVRIPVTRASAMSTPRPARRSMDIRKPAPKANATLKSVPVRKKSATSIRGVAMTACAVFALNALILSSGTIGSTYSYFNDTESSLANRLVASAIDFVVETDGNDYGFVNGVLNEEDGAVVQVVSPEEGSSPARFELEVEFVSGSLEFCNAIGSDVSTPFTYNGPLTGLSASNVEFGTPWSLGLSLASSTIAEGTICSINFVYKAYRVDEEDNTGYTDEEKVPLTLTVLAPEASPEQFLRTAVVTDTTPEVEILIPTEGTSTPSGLAPGEVVDDENASSTEGTPQDEVVPEEQPEEQTEQETVEILVPAPQETTPEDAVEETETELPEETPAAITEETPAEPTSPTE